MWSRDNKEEEVIVQNTIEEYIKTVEVPTNLEIEFKREIKLFVRNNYDMLNYIYNNCFKEYSHINKTDFYIFAYYNSGK
jgi:hypothetical protein